MLFYIVIMIVIFPGFYSTPLINMSPPRRIYEQNLHLYSDESRRFLYEEDNNYDKYANITSEVLTREEDITPTETATAAQKGLLLYTDITTVVGENSETTMLPHDGYEKETSTEDYQKNNTHASYAEKLTSESDLYFEETITTAATTTALSNLRASGSAYINISTMRRKLLKQTANEYYYENPPDDEFDEVTQSEAQMESPKYPLHEDFGQKISREYNITTTTEEMFTRNSEEGDEAEDDREVPTTSSEEEGVTNEEGDELLETLLRKLTNTTAAGEDASEEDETTTAMPGPPPQTPPEYSWQPGDVWASLAHEVNISLTLAGALLGGLVALTLVCVLLYKLPKVRRYCRACRGPRLLPEETSELN